MAEIAIEKTLGELLQEVRYELSKTEMKKSGYNPFGKYNYFELKDFLPLATKLFNERKMLPVFRIENQGGIEVATLTIYKGVESITFPVPTAESNNSANPIQNLGSKITYLRRYLYLIALDLVENDAVDAVDPNAKKTNFATEFQVDKLFTNKEVLMDKFQELNIKTKNNIKALTVEQASELLQLLEERLQNAD